MQRLPNFLILDFCEWLKRSILTKSQYKNIDMWELLFNERYDKLLNKKAEEYCDRERMQRNLCSNDTIKKIFNEIVKMFYVSNEFQELCYSVGRYKGEHLVADLFWAFKRFLYQFEGELNDQRSGFYQRNYYYDVEYVSADALVNNLKYYYKHSLDEDQEKNPFLQLIVEGKALEIEFLEWIQQKNIGKEIVEKIDLMPVEVFEEYARRFCEDTGNGVSERRKLVKAFKRSDPGNLLNKLRSLLPYDSPYRKRKFRYVSQRYLDDEAIYKCVILPIEADYDKFYELVTSRWKDLNDTSADYLDIYYCFANYGESGHDLMKQLHYLPEKFHAKLPCIALWKENMDEAMCIPINELSVEDVYYMIAGVGGIVDLIIEGKSINEIVKGVNDMGEERRNKERPFNKYIQNANNAKNVQQNMVIRSTNTSIRGEWLNENTDAFITEIVKAISLVETSELAELQKKEVKSILEEAKESVQEKSEEKASSSKKRFLTFLTFAGNSAQKLISALAGLSTLAKFFGIVNA